MRIAVTGAGGLLGSSLVEHCHADGHDVVAMSSSLPETQERGVVRWHAGDHWRDTARLLHGVDVLVHAAAYVPANHADAAEAARCIEVNALGTLSLLRAAEHAGVGRFVYVSGSNTLAPRGNLVSEDDPVGCEHAPYYLGSKVLGEIYVRAAVANGMNGLIVRPSSIYGPGMTRGVLVAFAERLRRSQPVRVADGGAFRADYVWRGDVVRLLGSCARDRRCGAVNVGSGTAVSVLDVAWLLCEILDADRGLVEVEPGGTAGSRPGFAAVDIARAREWYDHRPTSLRDGLLEWFGRGAG